MRLDRHRLAFQQQVDGFRALLTWLCSGWNGPRPRDPALNFVAIYVSCEGQAYSSPVFAAWRFD